MMTSIDLQFFVLLINVLAIYVSASQSDLNDECPKIKTRSKWDGGPPATVDYQTIPIPYVIIHHTVSQTCSTFATCAQQVRNIQHYHQTTKQWPDVGYNFLIGNDGNIYEGVGWHKIGTHLSGYNSKSIGIAFIGNFTDELPVPKALKAAKDLLQCGVNSGELKRNYRLLGARQLKNTESPGSALYTEIQDWDNWVTAP